jgi:hypothetical protein
MVLQRLNLVFSAVGQVKLLEGEAMRRHAR